MNKSFTLIELLIVIAIIAIITTAIIMIVTPGERLAQARNATREAHAHALTTSLLVYQIDIGEIPESIDTLLKEICNTGNAQPGHSISCTNMVDLSILVPEHIATIPVDPQKSNGSSGTGYYVAKQGSDIGIIQGLKEISCPEQYVGIPGNPLYGTTDFCIMKYEAKAWDTQESEVVAEGCKTVGGDPGCEAHWVGNNNQTRYEARSIPEGYPWRAIALNHSTNYDAKLACQAVGGQVITNPQWMTIARNIEAQPQNWTGGIVGTGHLFRGHTNNDPEARPLDAVNDPEIAGSDFNQRTHTLSNGEVIWDFSGNVYNWVDYTISGEGSQPQVPEHLTSYNWKQINEITDWGNILSYHMIGSGNSTWTSSQSIGRIYYQSDQTGSRTFCRGGSWSATSYAGAFALNLTRSPASSDRVDFGFRCAR